MMRINSLLLIYYYVFFVNHISNYLYSYIQKNLIFCRTSLTLADLLPEEPKLYDKMRPPKKDGRPTIVYFHVTVMGLDSIDENSMVIIS